MFKTTVSRALGTMMALSLSQQAFSLETIGPTHRIDEPNMLEEIHEKLQERERDGSLASMQNEFAARARQSVEAPRPTMGLVTTTKARSYLVDPTWTAPNTVVTPDGKTIIQAGQTINPLDYMTWSRKFLFFDGTDRRQINKAAEIISAEKGAVRAIMTAGRPLDLTRTWKRQIYFDQGGVLVKKLSIRQVPALVYQEGKKLRVDEIIP